MKKILHQKDVILHKFDGIHIKKAIYKCFYKIDKLNVYQICNFSLLFEIKSKLFLLFLMISVKFCFNKICFKIYLLKTPKILKCT